MARKLQRIEDLTNFIQGRQALLERCSQETDLGWQVHLALDRHPVDVSSGSSSYRIALSDRLLESLQFRKMGQYRLAWLNAHIQTLHSDPKAMASLCSSSKTCSDFDAAFSISFGIHNICVRLVYYNLLYIYISRQAWQFCCKKEGDMISTSKVCLS